MGRTGKGNVRRRRDGDVWGATSGGRVHMYGARIRPVLPPHRAGRQDRARRARPRRRLRHPRARPADERLADRNPRSRLAGLAGTVRRVGGPAHEPLLAGRDRPAGQDRPRRVRRARRTGRRRWRSGPCHRRSRPSTWRWYWGEFVRCFHRPPGNSSPTRRSTVGGGGTRKPARDPIGYGREAMRWRMWSNWRQVSARSGGQSLKKYNRFDITDHHRSDMGPSKPRVAGSNPAGRATFPPDSADCAE